ncbi:hypothetical protein Tco_1464044, partial [Tanacetum coccineum]
MTTESDKSLAMNLKSSTDHRTWDMRDQVKITLGVIDLDHALRIDPPITKTAESTADQKRACAHTKYDGVSGVREHIMAMSDMANKLKGMDIEISE